MQRFVSRRNYLCCVVVASFIALPVAGAARQGELPYGYCFKDASRSSAIPVVLLQAVVATESNWNPRARSHANAHGLMQIQWPGTARHLGVRRVSQLYKPCTNIKLGARYLRELLDRYNNDERRALAAYNYGPGRIGTTGSIPAGAEIYVATVRRHQAMLLGTSLPKARPNKASPKSAIPGKERVAAFSSRMRAKRFADLLRKRIPSGSFAVVRSSPGRYELWLTEGVNQLSANDRVLLTSLGWRS